MLVKTIKKFIYEIIIFLIFIGMFYNYISNWASAWFNVDSFYAFAPFVFLFTGYLLKNDFEQLKNAKKQVSLYGLILLILALCFYVVGIRTGIEYFVSISASVFISGIILFLYGFKVLKMLFIPIFLCTLTLPIFPLHRITMPLQMFSANVASDAINFLGVSCYNEGNIILIDNKYRMTVVSGCSGLKSLSTLFVISIIYSYLIKLNLLKNILLTVSTIPIALFFNVLRLMSVGFYILYNGYEGSEAFHDNAGIVAYILGIGSVLLLAKSMETNIDEDEENYEKE